MSLETTITIGGRRIDLRALTERVLRLMMQDLRLGRLRAGQSIGGRRGD